ncbi:MAG: hypothetical protein IQL11_16415 [Bacteroidales bacterium]|nr:hypothetical protein [Bacteroidales bacterium]
MKNYILMLLALGALTAGCEKRQFDFASSYSESASYTIDLTGPFNHTTTVSLDETLDVLDVPDETDIDAIYIKSISLKGQTLQNNEATGVDVSGTITYDGQSTQLFNSNHIEIQSNGFTELGLSDLNSTAISFLKEFMTAVVKEYLGFPVGSFNLTDHFFTITLAGSPTPAESARINLSIEIRISFDLGFSGCIKTLPFLGEECLQP